jgi:hypothetical protein
VNNMMTADKMVVTAVARILGPIYVIQEERKQNSAMRQSKYRITGKTQKGSTVHK